MNRRKILLFLGLTFGVNWGMVLVYRLLGGRWSGIGALLLAVAYMFIPMIMAIVVQRLHREPVKEPLGISFRLNRWFLVAWLLPPAIAFLTLGITLLLPGISYSPEMAGMFERFKALLTPEQVEQMREQVAAARIHPVWLGLLQGLVAGATINAVAGFGEELGWRGFLQKELAALGFWRSSFLIGAIWGVWHAPLILQGHNFPQHPVAGVFLMTLATVFLGPILSYVRVRANSVIAAAIGHGTVNATYGLAIMLVKGGNDLTTGVFGLPGIAALALVTLGLYVYDRHFAAEPLDRHL
ncbi:MAG TPA: CPBP family intramembrane metalloprotease [Firmicutes bacterium]|nr:CPBP family intramembrane metalloprotease [Bacillota bacterium]